MYIHQLARAIVLSLLSISLSYAVTQNVTKQASPAKQTEVAQTSVIIHLKNKKELDEAIAYQGPKVFKCSTTWCGPCQKIKENIEKLARQFPEVKVYVVDENNDFRTFMDSHKVQGFPTLIFLPSGQKLAGERPFAEFEQAFKAIAKTAKK